MSAWVPMQLLSFIALWTIWSISLAIELMNAAQGIDFRRPAKTSPVLERFLHEYRKEVPFVKEDIVMYKEIHKTVAFLNRTKFDY